MRNFSEATVASTVVFRNPSYEVALEWARTEQKGALQNTSFTIAHDSETNEGIVTRHDGYNGGNPPRQPIISDYKD